MIIDVCVGSSCHQKGSYEVIQLLQDLIEKNNLKDKVELKASFCLGDCMNGVSMRVDGEAIEDANPGNIEEIFNRDIITKV